MIQNLTNSNLQPQGNKTTIIYHHAPPRIPPSPHRTIAQQSRQPRSGEYDIANSPTQTTRVSAA